MKLLGGREGHGWGWGGVRRAQYHLHLVTIRASGSILLGLSIALLLLIPTLQDWVPLRTHQQGRMQGPGPHHVGGLAPHCSPGSFGHPREPAQLWNLSPTCVPFPKAGLPHITFSAKGKKIQKVREGRAILADLAGGKRIPGGKWCTHREVKENSGINDALKHVLTNTVLPC